MTAWSTRKKEIIFPRNVRLVYPLFSKKTLLDNKWISHHFFRRLNRPKPVTTYRFKFYYTIVILKTYYNIYNVFYFEFVELEFWICRVRILKKKCVIVYFVTIKMTKKKLRNIFCIVRLEFINGRLHTKIKFKFSNLSSK